MKEKLREVEKAALKEIGSSKDSKDALRHLRIKYLGRKGIITELFKKMSEVAPAEKAEVGAVINAVKSSVTRALDDSLKGASLLEEEHVEKIDITLPGISQDQGKMHPLTRTIEEISDIFISLGFRVVEGPEIETEYYNFEALNIPLEHPSRDAFDTFYLASDSGKHLLRSHTSPVQARFMEQNKPPFSIIVPGKVFRPDATDATHSFMFHQVEGLVVAEDIKFSDLKGTLEMFAIAVFGDDIKMRFRPHFFPFTEPSAEVDISCIICKGKGCSVCGRKGWLEVLGSGMIHPNVFKRVGYDSKKYTGFAFGMGIERIAMLKYSIDDIRLFFENDLRFLNQF